MAYRSASHWVRVVSGLFQRPMVDRLTLNVSAICAAQVLAGKSLMSWLAGYLGCDLGRFMGVLGELEELLGYPLGDG